MFEQKHKNHYEMLGISFYASNDEIQRAVESALRRTESIGADLNDPTVAGEIAAKKRPIMQAYMTLKDPERRRQYNASLTAKISEAARVVAESKAFATGTAAATSQATANPGVVIAGAVASAGAVNSESNAPVPPSKYEAVDLRASFQQRANEREAAAGESQQSFDLEALLGVRFVAMMIDLAVITAFYLGCFFILLQFEDSESAVTLFIAKVVLLGGPIAYYMFCESGKHRSTWGKRLMGLRVYRSDGETPVGFLRGAARYVLRIVSSILLLGYIIAFFTERKQALHDLASDTVVFQAKDPPALWWLVGFVSVVILPMVFMHLSEKAKYSALSTSLGMRSQIRVLPDETIDPNRASPTVEEVQLAYSAGLSMQRVLIDYYATNKQWPSGQREQREQLIAQSAQPQLLRDHNVIVSPRGLFALSLGGTAKGTARMFFIPDQRGDSVRWLCVPMNIARKAEIEQCSR